MGETIRGKEKQDDQLCTTLPDYVLQNTTKPNKLMLPIKYWKVIVHLCYHHHIMAQTMRRIGTKIQLYIFLSVYSVYWFKKEKVDVKRYTMLKSYVCT